MRRRIGRDELLLVRVCAAEKASRGSSADEQELVPTEALPDCLR